MLIMTNSIELLDWFSTRISGGTDYMIAKTTGITKQTISKVRTGKNELSDNNMMLLLVVGNHPEPVKTLMKLKACIAEKQGNDKMAKIWGEYVA